MMKIADVAIALNALLYSQTDALLPCDQRDVEIPVNHDREIGKTDRKWLADSLPALIPHASVICLNTSSLKGAPT
jgi:hypothetical protein